MSNVEYCGIVRVCNIVEYCGILQLWNIVEYSETFYLNLGSIKSLWS